MHTAGRSEVQYRQLTTIWFNFCDTKPEWTARKHVQLREILWQYHVCHGPKQQFRVNRKDSGRGKMLNDGNFAFLLCWISRRRPDAGHWPKHVEEAATVLDKVEDWIDDGWAGQGWAEHGWPGQGWMSRWLLALTRLSKVEQAVKA